MSSDWCSFTCEALAQCAASLALWRSTVGRDHPQDLNAPTLLDHFATLDNMFFARLAIASLSGVGAHLLYFIRGEHHLAAPHIGVTYLILSAIAVLYTCIFEPHGDGRLHASFAGLALLIAHVLALWISIIIYRLFFHRLRRFPGPLSMRVSKLTHIYYLLRNKAKNHILLEELRKEYGDIVRTGKQNQAPRS